MSQVKPESNMDQNEEFIDVSGGDDPDIQHLVADPSIIRSTRRSRRQIEASPYAQYSRRIITRNAHLDEIDAYEEIDDAEEDGRQMGFNPEIEMEISNDVALIQQARTRK